MPRWSVGSGEVIEPALELVVKCRSIELVYFHGVRSKRLQCSKRRVVCKLQAHETVFAETNKKSCYLISHHVV